MNTTITAMRRALLVPVLLAAALTPVQGQAPQPKTTPVTVPEARDLMGYPPSARERVLGGLEGIKVAILDNGFAGLEEWLKANPKEAKLTKAIKLLPGNTGTHGFNVYRVARQVLGDAEIYLYDFPAMQSDVPGMIADMKSRGIQIVNASFGWSDYPINRRVSPIVASLHNTAFKEELFFFFSSGNDGARVHSFDAKAAGFTYTIPDLMTPHGNEKRPVLVIRPQRGRIVLHAYWNEAGPKEPPLAIEVVRKNGASLALLTAGGNDQTLTVFDEKGGKAETKAPREPGRLLLELSGLANEEHMFSCASGSADRGTCRCGSTFAQASLAAR